MYEEVSTSPRRAPHWRWLRAVQIDAGGRKASRKLDGPEGFAWIRRASRLKRHYDKANNRHEAIYALIERDPDLFWAHNIWVEDRAPTRWAIEARVLAGEDNEKIAYKAATTPEIVGAYINVFFDVRGLLDRDDYILNVVLSDAVTRGVQERHYDLLWKMLGYRGGPYVLEAAINRFIKTEAPKDENGVSGFFHEFAINTMKYKAAIAALTVQANTHTQMQLIDSFVKYSEIEKNSENAGKAHTAIVSNIGEMLSSLPFRVGTKANAADIKMVGFDDKAAELNSAEMMVVNSGGNLSNQKEIEELKFPGE
jgi:hypothetical protein